MYNLSTLLIKILYLNTVIHACSEVEMHVAQGSPQLLNLQLSITLQSLSYCLYPPRARTTGINHHISIQLCIYKHANSQILYILFSVLAVQCDSIKADQTSRGGGGEEE